MSLETASRDETMAERAVLGAILVDQKYLADVAEEVEPQDFFLFQHQVLFRAMLELAAGGRPVDPIVLVEACPRVDPGYISQLMDGIPKVVNASHYARLVQKASMRRQLVSIGTDLAVSARDDDPEACIEMAARRLRSLQVGSEESPWVQARQAFEAVLDNLEARKGGAILAGLTSGFPDLDRVTDGWKAGELVILAGTPGMGKSSLLLNVAVAAARVGTVAVFSLEMSVPELAKRMLSAGGKVAASTMRSGQLSELDWAKVSMGFSRMMDLPLFIDPSSVITTRKMLAKSQRLKEEKGLVLVVVDYIQRVSPSKADNREQEVAGIARDLKSMARELNVPVLAACSLNNEAIKRDGPPQLGDLRDSGNTGYEADVVTFVYRPNVQRERLGKAKVPDDETKAMLFIPKQRNGESGFVPLYWNPKTASFESMSRQEER